MENGYFNSLKRFMRVRWVAFAIVVACFGVIWFIGGGLQSELAPMEDRSQFRLQVSAPEGTSFDYMDKYIDNLAQLMIDSVDERRIVLTVTAPGFTGAGAVNTGFVRISLVDPKDRTRSQQEIVDMINRNLPKYNEGRAFAVQEQTISVNRRGGLPVQFVIQNNDFDKITNILPKFLEEANKSPVFQGVDTDLKLNKPELKIDSTAPAMARGTVNIMTSGSIKLSNCAASTRNIRASASRNAKSVFPELSEKSREAPASEVAKLSSNNLSAMSSIALIPSPNVRPSARPAEIVAAL